MTTFIHFKLPFSENGISHGLRITKKIEDFIPKIFQNINIKTNNNLQKETYELYGEKLQKFRDNFLNYCLFHVDKVKNDKSQERKEFGKFPVFNEELHLDAKGNKIDLFLISSNNMFGLIEEAISKNSILHITIEIISPPTQGLSVGHCFP